MRITTLTLFEEMYDGVINTSIISRAKEKGVVDIDFVNIRDFAKDKFKHVDDAPFGGGAGMVMKCEPVLDALSSVRNDKSHVILMSPHGKTFNQAKAKELTKYDYLILIAGHYEGLDYRITKHVDEELSIGDYILTGGELASMVVIDAVTRLLDGAINSESIMEESFENDLLEYPQYTQPRNYEGDEVPEVLVSGNHAKIREYRILQSLLITKEKRPDLFEKHILTEEEKKILKRYEDENE